MPDLADLFPGFASHWIDTANGRFFARSGGSGPPLLLLHGYPQTHVEWHKIAPRLAERFTLVVMDLRGYGWSSLPEGANGEGMSKRAMAQDAVDVMEKLGHVRFRLVGHDRGGRVAYRLAYDHPGRLEKVVTIDIVPTFAMFADMDRTEGALKKYHWLFLAQPAPFPETLIGASARYYLDHTLASWTATKDLTAYDPRALAHYRAAFDDPSRIAASCEGLSRRRADRSPHRQGRPRRRPQDRGATSGHVGRRGAAGLRRLAARGVAALCKRRPGGADRVGAFCAGGKSGGLRERAPRVPRLSGRQAFIQLRQRAS